MPIDTHHSAYDKALPDWTRNRVVVEGERAVKAAGATYLPRLSGQGTKFETGKGYVDEYESYKDRAAFFPATSRTLDGLTGLIFRKDPQAELPAIVEPMAKDIDMRGQSLGEFAQKIVDDVMQAPHGGILVDHPQTPGTEVTQTQADSLGWRPYITHYPAEKVFNWEMGRVNNRTVLTQVRLFETVDESGADEWTTKAVEQIRVLRLARVAEYDERVYQVVLFRKLKDAVTGEEKWKETSRFVPIFRGKPSTAIPFVFLGPRDTSPDVQKAPLTDIASVNVQHYKNSADYENGLHWVGVPTPVFVGQFVSEGGDKVTEVKLGSASGIQLETGGEAMFLEFQGTGLSALKEAMADKQADMAVLGARILAVDKKQTEAAETAAIHRAGENSVLASLANAVSKALEIALGIMAAWSGDETSEISYRLNTDYQPVAMSAQDLTALLAAWQAGALSKEELFDAMQSGEIIRDDKAIADHEAEVEAEAEARDAKAAAKAEVELARTAAMVAKEKLAAGQGAA